MQVFDAALYHSCGGIPTVLNINFTKRREL